MTIERPRWWPPSDPPAWYCTLGHGCAEGWFVTRGKLGEADTAERCPCLRENIRENRRRRQATELASSQPQRGDW